MCFTCDHFSYRLRFLATRCPQGWRWCQARTAPSTRVLLPGPRRRCSPPPSVCAPLSAHTARRSRCCPPWPGGGGGEGLGWRREIPSAKTDEEVWERKNKKKRKPWYTSEPTHRADANKEREVNIWAILLGLFFIYWPLKEILSRAKGRCSCKVVQCTTVSFLNLSPQPQRWLAVGEWRGGMWTALTVSVEGQN